MNGYQLETYTFQSNSEAETESIGRHLSDNLSAGDIVLLHANLGAGKTVMTRGIAQGLSINEPISSPTFAIVQEYEGKTKFYHIDLYRLADIYAADTFGIEEYMHDQEAITVIEWPSRIKELIDDSMIQVNIKYIDGGREITIKSDRTLNL